MFLLGEVAWFAESCDIEDEVVNKQKKIISEILEENEKWQPFGGHCLDRSATKKFEISETFCISTYRSMFWVFFSRTKVLFVNRDYTNLAAITSLSPSASTSYQMFQWYDHVLESWLAMFQGPSNVSSL